LVKIVFTTAISHYQSHIQAITKPGKNMLFFFKLIDYLLAAVAGTSVLVIYVDSSNQQYVTAASVALTVAIGLFLLNRQSVKNAKKEVQRIELSQKAELYTSLLSNGTTLDYNTVLPARAKALEYCQELIDDYKSSRNLARTLYYVLQISTVVLSGVTPILVLVDKLEAGQSWLKWLPVICPAVASIVASIVTSFPFQKNWMAANKAVELLEAEQEKFILGISPAYRCYDIPEEDKQQQRVSQAIELFINQVNNIHLQQVQQNNDGEQENKEKQDSQKSEQATTEQKVAA
jgi:ABC-type sugar transport system permease subunit